MSAYKLDDDELGSNQNLVNSQTTTGTASTDTPQRSIPKDRMFHLLQNARRRAVLRYLLSSSDREQFRMRDVAEAVAAWEHDTTVQQLTYDERQRVYIALYQSHLPKLDEHGVINYNQPRGIIEPTPLVAVFEPFLEDGLHADTNHLIISDADATQPAESDSNTNIFHTLSNLFN